MQLRLAKVIVSLACTAIVGSVGAAPVIYFGENVVPGGSVAGGPVTARAAFLSALTAGVSSEGFEALSAGTSVPITLSFNGSAGAFSAELSGNGRVAGPSDDDPELGRFNTTPDGGQWWWATSTFTISFGTPISAFGFYGTDIGDIGGQIPIVLETVGGTFINLLVLSTISAPNGALLFWGFVDTVDAYSSISFGNTAAGWDVFGFDDMVLADRGQILNVGPDPGPGPAPVPEPGTLALLAAGLVGLGVARRRRR